MHLLGRRKFELQIQLLLLSFPLRLELMTSLLALVVVVASPRFDGSSFEILMSSIHPIAFARFVAVAVICDDDPSVPVLEEMAERRDSASRMNEHDDGECTDLLSTVLHI